MTTVTDWQKGFIPGMGVTWLLPLYDPFTRLLGLDRVRRELIVQADLQSCHRVLDVGCGTGSLAVLIKRLYPANEVIGLDPDQQALARARAKAARAGATVQFDRGFADSLDYPAQSFDRVFSSFMFHHLERRDKQLALREIRRVLKDDGSLHLVDFSAPSGDNARRTVLALMSDAGLANATNTRDALVLGGLIRLAYYRAGRAII